MSNPNLFRTYCLITSLLCLVIMGCDRNPCESEDVNCGTFGNCVQISEEARCLCTTGYEKDSNDQCEIKQVAKFLGTWRVRDIRRVDGIVRSSVYQIEIAENPNNVVGVLIDNFADLSLTDTAGNVLCEPRILGSVSRESIVIAGVNDGISYCDAQGQGLGFSGYRFSNAQGSFNNTGDTLFLDYELRYTFQDENGDPETTEIISNSTLTRP